MTGSSSCWVAAPRRASASASASTGCCWRSPRGGARGDGRPRVDGRGRRGPGGHGHAAAHRDRAPGGGLSARAELGQRKLGKQLESAGREGAHLAVICGDELGAGQVLVRDLQAGTQRPVALAELAREVARSEAQHHHGDGGR